MENTANWSNRTVGINRIFNYIPPELWEYIAKTFLHTREDYRSLRDTDPYLSSKFTDKTIIEFYKNNTKKVMYRTTTAIFMFEYSAFFSDDGDYIYMKNGLIHRDDKLPALCISDVIGNISVDDKRVKITKFYDDILKIMNEDDAVYDTLIAILHSDYILCLTSWCTSKIYMYYHDGDINIHSNPIGVCGHISYIYRIDDNHIMNFNRYGDAMGLYNHKKLDNELICTHMIQNIDKCELKWKKMMDDIYKREQLFSPTAYKI